jgi:hypothetical protein
MRIKRTDAGNEPDLDKAEVRCLMDAKAIIEAAQAIEGHDAMDSTIRQLECVARYWGAKHFDEKGNLKPAVSRKATPLLPAPPEPDDIPSPS